MCRISRNDVMPFFIFLYCICNSCAPKITSFSARPYTTIAKADSVQFNWKLKGKPTLLFYMDPASDDENPAKYYLSYKLVAQKGKKEVSFPTLSLTVLPDTSIDYIIIHTIHRGDSAIAIAVRDTLEWGYHFVIAGLASASGRGLTVTHLGKTVTLDADGKMSAALDGLTNSGEWQISSPLSPEEKQDSSRIPGRLSIKTIIVHKKH